MKNLITAMLFSTALLTLIPLSTSAIAQERMEVRNPLDLPHSTLMRLLHIVAKEFHMNMHVTRAHYENGEITITIVEQNGIQYYMLGYDGYCILAALEDNL